MYCGWHISPNHTEYKPMENSLTSRIFNKISSTVVALDWTGAWTGLVYCVVVVDSLFQLEVRKMLFLTSKYKSIHNR